MNTYAIDSFWIKKERKKHLRFSTLNKLFCTDVWKRKYSFRFIKLRHILNFTCRGQIANNLFPLLCFFFPHFAHFVFLRSIKFKELFSCRKETLVLLRLCCTNAVSYADAWVWITNECLLAVLISTFIKINSSEKCKNIIKFDLTRIELISYAIFNSDFLSVPIISIKL